MLAGVGDRHGVAADLGPAEDFRAAAAGGHRDRRGDRLGAGPVQAGDRDVGGQRGDGGEFVGGQQEPAAQRRREHRHGLCEPESAEPVAGGVRAERGGEPVGQGDQPRVRVAGRRRGWCWPRRSGSRLPIACRRALVDRGPGVAVPQRIRRARSAWRSAGWCAGRVFETRWEVQGAAEPGGRVERSAGWRPVRSAAAPRRSLATWRGAAGRARTWTQARSVVVQAGGRRPAPAMGRCRGRSPAGTQGGARGRARRLRWRAAGGTGGGGSVMVQVAPGQAARTARRPARWPQCRAPTA